MNQSTTFVRHFARLVSLLIDEPTNVDEQKGALRAIVTLAKDGAVRLALADGALQANGATVPAAFTGVSEVTERLGRHAVTALSVERGAAAADLLNVARLLAYPEPPPGGAAGTAQRVQALGLRTVQVESTAGAVPAAPAAGAPPTVEVPALPSVDAAAAPPADAGILTAVTLDELELVDLPELIDLVDLPPAAPGAQGGAAEPGRPSQWSADPGAGFAFQEGGGMFAQFASASRPIDPAEKLFERVDRATGGHGLGPPLQELTDLAEQSGRDGKPAVMADVLAGLVRREAQSTDDGVRRAFAMAIKRLSTPFLLRGVAGLLPHARERTDDYRSVLVRAGEDGADALIDLLTQAQNLGDRRVYFDVLLTLGSGVDALIHMLGDQRWYVARNAAELLGKMQAVEAEAELVKLLPHDEGRVRRAAAIALMRIAAPAGIKAIEALLQHPLPEARIDAAGALATRRSVASSQLLARALDTEEHTDVQEALLSALGKVGSPDAVERLIRAAEPEGRLFRRKPVELRVAALHALAETKAAPAIAALEALRDDKEKEVRDAAARLLVAAAKPADAPVSAP